MKPDRFDQKRIDAWNEIPERMQFAIREALLKPTRLGAVINARGRDDRDVKTSLGYVVHSSFVTPLARELIEALEFNGVEAPAKPKRRAS